MKKRLKQLSTPSNYLFYTLIERIGTWKKKFIKLRREDPIDRDCTNVLMDLSSPYRLAVSTSRSSSHEESRSRENIVIDKNDPSSD